jgi:hypothetical protein
MTLCLQIKDLGGLMNQLAAERYAQKLSIRYVSGPRNQFVIHKAGPQDSGLFFYASHENWVGVFLATGRVAGILEPDNHRSYLELAEPLNPDLPIVLIVTQRVHGVPRHRTISPTG